MDQLLATWPSTVDNQERTRRLIDLFLVSVLLDAGAGTRWSYKSKESGRIYRRSEGLAVASLEMFKGGMFSSDPNQPCRVDTEGLQELTLEQLAKGLQVTATNPLNGLEGRAGLLSRLADALMNPVYFGADSRPGKMLGLLVYRWSRCADVLTMPRLSNLSSLYPGILRTHRAATNPMECPHEWSCTNMARVSHFYCWSTTRRRLALQIHARLATGAALGDHCSIPQTYPMACLLTHGTHVETATHTICGRRPLDRAT